MKALGIEPRAWHLNEGHSAFMLVERTRELTAAGVDMDEALARVKRNAVFTIHTPVSAGNERFESDLVRKLVAPMAEDSGLDLERIISLARGTDNDPGQFDMTAFSLRLTNGANAVSQLHAQTANSDLDRRPRQADPGHHQRRPSAVLDRRAVPPPVRADLGATWTTSTRARTRSGRASRASRTRSSGRRTSARSSSSRSSAGAGCRSQFARHGEAPHLLEELSEALDPDVLTIGFARRFATYKRAALLFSDEERLARILLNDAAPRPDRLRRQGPSGRPARPARHPGHLHAQPPVRSSTSASSSSRTTTSASGATSCRASMSG